MLISALYLLKLNALQPEQEQENADIWHQTYGLGLFTESG